MLIQPLAIQESAPTVAPVAVPAMPVLFGTRRAVPSAYLAAALADETAAALGLTAAQPIPPGDRAGPSGSPGTGAGGRACHAGPVRHPPRRSRSVWPGGLAGETAVVVRASDGVRVLTARRPSDPLPGPDRSAQQSKRSNAMLIQPLAVEAPVAVPAMPVLFGTRRAIRQARLAAVLASETAAQPVPPGDRAQPTGSHPLPLAFNVWPRSESSGGPMVVRSAARA